MAAHYELVALVGKARGLEGEVTASIADGLPCCLFEGLRVHVVPPTLYGPRDITLSSVRAGKQNALVVAFDEVTTRDDAEQIAGRGLLADVRDIDLEPEDARWVIGLPVRDERYGELGEVTEIIETPANDVLVVEGPFGEVLVPVIEQVVLQVLEEGSGPIVTHLMDGLVEGGPEGVAGA